MERVLICRNIALETGHEIKLRIEDSRLRKWYGNAGREELQGGRIGQPGCVDLGNAVQRAADRLPDDLPDRQACENEGDTVQPPDPDGARPHQSAAGMPQGGK